MLPVNQLPHVYRLCKAHGQVTDTPVPVVYEELLLYDGAEFTLFVEPHHDALVLDLAEHWLRQSRDVLKISHLVVWPDAPEILPDE